MQSEPPLIIRYRETLEDIATPTLDCAVLSAARRYSARRRAGRRIAVVVMFGALSVVTAGLARRAAQHVQRLPAVTNYGWSEGASRDYLLTTEFVTYPVSEMNQGTPGMNEGPT